MNTNKAKMMIKHEISTPIFGVLKKTTCEFVKKNKYKKSIKRFKATFTDAKPM